MTTTSCSLANAHNASVDGPGIGFRQFEAGMVFALAEVLAPEQLLGADDLRALIDRAPQHPELPRQIGRRIGAARHLRDPHAHDAGPRGCAGAAG